MTTKNSKSEITEPEVIEIEAIEIEAIESKENKNSEQARTANAVDGDIFEKVTATYYDTAKATGKSERSSSFADKVTATAESTDDPVNVIPDVLPHDGKHSSASQSQKIKGVAQMIAGGALTVAGVPLLILPGPGAVFIVGGVALASKGQRNFSGRVASPLESKLDSAAAKMAEIAKDQAKQAAQKAAKEAPSVAKNVAQQVPVVAKKAVEAAPAVAKKVADTAPVVAKKVADTAPVFAEKVAEHAPVVASKVAEGVSSVANTAIKTAPIVADKMAKSAPKVAEKVAKGAPEVAEKVIANAPTVAENVAKGFTKGISLGASLIKQAGTKVAETGAKAKSKSAEPMSDTENTFLIKKK